jgi:hypothetical protein
MNQSETTEDMYRNTFKFIAIYGGSFPGHCSAATDLSVKWHWNNKISVFCAFTNFTVI